MPLSHVMHLGHLQWFPVRGGGGLLPACSTCKIITSCTKISGIQWISVHNHSQEFPQFVYLSRMPLLYMSHWCSFQFQFHLLSLQIADQANQWHYSTLRQWAINGSNLHLSSHTILDFRSTSCEHVSPGISVALSFHICGHRILIAFQRYRLTGTL